MWNHHRHWTRVSSPYANYTQILAIRYHFNVSKKWKLMSQGWERAIWNGNDILITCSLVGLLVSFPFQHSSVSEQCNDPNHNEEDNAKYKYHATIFICPIASFHDPVESRGRQFGRDYFNDSHFVRLWAGFIVQSWPERDFQSRNQLFQRTLRNCSIDEESGPRIAVDSGENDSPYESRFT